MAEVEEPHGPRAGGLVDRPAVPADCSEELPWPRAEDMVDRPSHGSEELDGPDQIREQMGREGIEEIHAALEEQLEAAPHAANGGAEEEAADSDPVLEPCACGKPVDVSYLENLLERKIPKCRLCKCFQLLHQGLEVDKYASRSAVMSRKRKTLRLSSDNEDLQIQAKRRFPGSAMIVPIHELLGVVFGAYTCTFKRQKAANLPPHWAAFSLISQHRTYDFSAVDPSAVECCVIGLQQVIWDRRQQDARLPGSGDARRTLAFAPWTTGFLLWMRLRFRLQEQAQLHGLGFDHMLWIVFMTSALSCYSESSKERFIAFADRIQDDYKVDVELNTVSRDLFARINFQRQRIEKILEDKYECKIHQNLPRAPGAVTAPNAARPSYSSAPREP